MKNSLARRAAVQVTYRNHFYFEENVDFFLKDDEFLVGHIGNEILFSEIFSQCIFLWNYYDNLFSFLSFDKSSKSLVAVSIFKVFLAEHFLCKTDYKILLKEYLVLLNSFCPTDASIMKIYLNRTIEENVVSKKDILITIDESSNI